MGLFWSMERQDEAAPAIPLDGDFPLTLAAGGPDGARAEARLERRLVSSGVTSRDVENDGLVGTLFTPSSPGPHPAPGDSVYFAPPLVVTEAEIDRLIGVTRDAIKVVLGF